jgi:hypothetical protein
VLRRLIIALVAALTCFVGAAGVAHAAPSDLRITAPGEQGVDTTPLVQGTADPGYPVHLLVNGVEVASVSPAADGAWSHQLTDVLPVGEQALIAAEVRAADGSVLADTTVGYLVLPPVGQARIVEPADGATVGGVVDVVARATDSASDARLLVDGVENGDYLGWDGDQSQLFESDLLTEGQHLLQVEVLDPFGRVMSSSSVTVTVDRTPPPPATITSHQAGDVVTDRTPTFAGTAQPNAPVVVRFDRSYEVLCSATADAAGHWSCSPTGEGAQHVASMDGRRVETALVVTTTDAVGNESASRPVGLVFDYRTANPPTTEQPTTPLPTTPQPTTSARPSADPASSAPVTTPRTTTVAAAVPELANTGSWSVPGTALGALLLVAGLGLHRAARRLDAR